MTGVAAAADLVGRLAVVRERIAAAAARAGRDAGEVTLVAVSKTRPLSDLLAAYEAGVRHFGENRVQEAEEKFPRLPADAVRHLVGPVQSNKTARAAKVADAVHSIDSVHVAERLARAAAALGKTLEAYVEVNTGGEESKAGVAPALARALVEAVRGLPGLSLRGLMAIPPPRDTRPHFRRLRELAGELSLPGLSMGMSDDFEAAVEEGATIVRIGTLLFGPREAA